MRKLRRLLLGLMVVLIALAGRSQAKAATMCIDNCWFQAGTCITACKGNQTCIQNCDAIETNCLKACAG